MYRYIITTNAFLILILPKKQKKKKICNKLKIGHQVSGHNVNELTLLVGIQSEPRIRDWFKNIIILITFYVFILLHTFNKCL